MHVAQRTDGIVECGADYMILPYYEYEIVGQTCQPDIQELNYLHI